jgi:hypothetical protein
MENISEVLGEKNKKKHIFARILNTTTIGL